MLPARIATAASHLPEGFEEVQVAEGIIAPVAMEFSPDGRLFVSQQSGQLRVIKDGALLVDPFLTVSVLSGFQRGLQGLAFDPSFEANGYVYVYYTSADTGRNRLSRFTASQSYPDVADPNSDLVILDIGLPAPGNYNGGSIYFGTDGNLFVSVGDHDTHANSQSLANLAGKLLRIDPTSYPDIIPPDNPFVETPDDPATRGEIWAYGLRNPFKIAVDPVSGSVYINDVGENDWEEINLGLKGANYGWSICEGPFQTNDPYGTGTCTDNSFEEPIYAYHHSFGSPTGNAITGGTFNRATQFPAEYAGDYFFSDYCGGWIYRLTPAGQVIAFATATEGFVVDLRFGLDGNLYYLDRTNRTVRRIQHAGAGNQSPIAAAAADPVLGFPPLTVNFDATGSSDPDNDPLTYTWDFGDGTAIETGVTVSHIYTSEGPYVAVLSVEDGKGGVDTVTVSIMVGNPPVASMNLPLGGANFDPGDTINYEGTATDAEDGDLPSDSFAWLIVLHHHWEGDPNHHIHPFLGPYEGGKNGTFTIPAGVHEGAVDIWYRIHLVVADSSNLTDEVTRDIFPNWEGFINAGGAAYSMSTGEAFLADRTFAAGSFGFVGGSDRTFGVAIEGTTDDLLFQTMRVGLGGPFSYIFDNLAPDDYQITLYFADPRSNSVGDRVFDVSVEGTVVLAGYDIVAAAGGYQVAHTETITVPVADGQLNVDFSGVIGIPVVSAVTVATVSPPEPGPSIGVSPTSLDFGQVVLNGTSDLTVTLTNSGSEVLTVSGLSSTNAVFTVVAPTAPVDIAANGGTQVVTVRFSPIALGNQVGNLEIVSNDPGGGLELVSLGGSGVAGGPYIIVFPTSLDFGEVVLNGTSDLTVTLTNSGGQVLTVTGVATTNAVFTVVAPTAPVDIGANGGTQVVTVRFSPIAFGTQVGNLEIVINDPDEGVMILALAGTGVERRINAGGEAYNTATGEAFLADRAYAGGSFGFVGARDRTYGVAIEGTTDDLLFQTMRVGNRPFSYIFDNLAPGDYQITLYFAEPRANSVGDRVFDVSVEGGVVLAGYDIVAAAGGYRVAHSETITVPVADGQLNVDFSRVTGFPVVSAVAVAAAGAG